VTTPRGTYGYNHRGRILAVGDLDGTYTVSVPTLAPTFAWGPIPAVVPDLVPGDQVLLCQVGTTRGDLVIVGKLPGEQPDISEISGLSAALAAKASAADLTTLTTRVGTDETAIGANATAIGTLGTRMTTAEGRLTTDETAIGANTASITANAGAITALTTRVTTAEGDIATDETNIATLTGWANYDWGNDFEVYSDYLSTLPRALASASVYTLSAGHGFYAKMRAHRAVTINVIKFCLATGGVAGTVKVAAYSGPSTTALTFRGTASVSLAAGRQDWTLGASAFSLAAGDYLVIGFLATGQTTATVLTCSPVVTSATLLNQDLNTLTSVSTTASTLTALPTTPLNMGTLTGYNLLAQIPWLAASP
jgi:hypothetical protein